MRGLGQRIHVAKAHQSIEGDLPIIRIGRSLRGATKEGLAELRKAILREQERRAFPAIRAVFCDTLSQNMTGDENSVEDMGDFIGQFKEWCATLSDGPVAAIPLHHPGHGDKSRARGSSFLPGDADAEMLLSGSRDRLTLKCSKMRDAARFEDVRLHLSQVPVLKSDGEQLRDRRGREQWSLVVEPLHRAKERSFSGDQLTEDEQKVLAVLTAKPENVKNLRAKAKVGDPKARVALFSLERMGKAVKHDGQRGTDLWSIAA